MFGRKKNVSSVILEGFYLKKHIINNKKRLLCSCFFSSCVFLKERTPSGGEEPIDGVSDSSQGFSGSQTIIADQWGGSGGRWTGT